MAQLNAPPGAACVKPMGDCTCLGERVVVMAGDVAGGTTVESVRELTPQQYSDVSRATAQLWLIELMAAETDLNFAVLFTGVGLNLFTAVLSPTFGCWPKQLTVPSASTPQVTNAPATYCVGL